MLISPLEQFKIISLFSLTIFSLDFSCTNLFFISILALVFFLFIIYFNSFDKSYLDRTTFYLIPSVWQVFVEIFYNVVAKLLFDNINLKGEKYLPLISMIFIFILFCNLVGLVPYSFTVTSHVLVTFTLSFSIFIGVNIIGFKKHRFNMMSLIIPSNSTLVLGLVLVPIELVSYLAKPVSLGVRLFINLMAGHTLLKVIVGFAWSMLLLENSLAFIHLIPLFLLVILMGLELAVALIQTYVFTVLTCIYLNDSVNLH